MIFTENNIKVTWNLILKLKMKCSGLTSYNNLTRDRTMDVKLIWIMINKITPFWKFFFANEITNYILGTIIIYSLIKGYFTNSLIIHWVDSLTQNISKLYLLASEKNTFFSSVMDRLTDVSTDWRTEVNYRVALIL